MLKAMSLAKDEPTSQTSAHESVRALDSRMQQAMQGAQTSLTTSAHAAGERSLPQAGHGAEARRKSQRRRHTESVDEAASAQAAMAYLFRLECRDPVSLGSPGQRESEEQQCARAGLAGERWAQQASLRIQPEARQPAATATLSQASLLANHHGASRTSLPDTVATLPIELPSSTAVSIKPGEPSATPMIASVAASVEGAVALVKPGELAQASKPASVVTPIKGAVAALATSARKAAQSQAVGKQHAMSQKPSQTAAVAVHAPRARANAAREQSGVSGAAALALALAPLGARVSHPGMPEPKAAPSSGRRLAYKAWQTAASGKQDGPLAYHFRTWGAGRSVTISQATRANGQAGYALQASDGKVERLLEQQLAATEHTLSQHAWLERGDGQQQQRQRHAPDAWDEDVES